MNILSGIQWGGTHNIIYSPLLLVVLLLLFVRYKKYVNVSKVLGASEWSNDILSSFSLKKKSIKLALFFFGSCFLFLSLLRPQWNVKKEIIAQEGRDLFIALDISRSMLAQDCEPNRLFFAKKKIESLLKMLSVERVGLILFSGSAFVQCPLTKDYDAFRMFLNHVEVETISSGTTALDQPIKQAIDAFSRGGERKTKLLVLVTDGEDFSGSLEACKKKMIIEGVSLCALGVGTPQGAPIPLFDTRGAQNGHQKDKEGKIVITRLNEQGLRGLVSQSGGLYLRALESEDDISCLAEKIFSFEKERFEDQEVIRFEEQYPYCAALSFICFVLEWLI